MLVALVGLLHYQPVALNLFTSPCTSSLLKYYLASPGGVKFWQKILIYYV